MTKDDNYIRSFTLPFAREYSAPMASKTSRTKSPAKSNRKIRMVSVRISAAEQDAIDKLKERLGVSADSQILCMGLRALVREQDAISTGKRR